MRTVIHNGPDDFLKAKREGKPDQYRLVETPRSPSRREWDPRFLLDVPPYI